MIIDSDNKIGLTEFQKEVNKLRKEFRDFQWRLLDPYRDKEGFVNIGEGNPALISSTFSNLLDIVDDWEWNILEKELPDD